MKWKELLSAHNGRAFKLLERYKWILLVIAVGLVLLVLPGGKESTRAQEQSQTLAAQSFDLAETEQKFAKALSEISGAGEVTVVLSVKTGTRQMLAEDSSYEEGDDGVKKQTATVVLAKGSGVEEAVKLQEIYPQFQGALIISSGGDDPVVQLKLTEATAALTGLGANKISICNRGK